MARALILLLVALLGGPVAQAETVTLGQLSQRLMSTPVVRGAFSQQRHLALFSQPLTSNGHFVISRGQGLIWTQESPISMTLVLTGQRLIQQLAGQAPEVIERSRQPAIFTFSELLLAIFQGDTARLKETFELTFDADPDGGWQLRLHPRSAPLDQILQSISLSGSDYIQQLRIEEVRGDRTEIQFSKIKTDIPLSQTEQGVLNG